MVALIVIGIVLLAGAVGLALWARSASRKAALLTEVPTYDCAQLPALAADAPGMRVEVKGRAEPAGEPMAAPLSNAACVWYEQVTRVRYWDVERDSEGRRRRVQRTREVSRETSPAPFVLRDATGAVTVLPDGASVDHAVKVHDRFEQAEGGGGLGGITIDLGPFSIGGDGGVIGYEREEHVIGPGAALYVLGGVQADPQGAAVGRPREGRFLISTRSEEAIVRSARRQSAIAKVLTGVAAAGGVVCIVLAVVL